MKTAEAIEKFGSAKALADALGLWPQAVYKWGENVPELRQYQIREILRDREAKA
jgi:transcriptional repressor of cell division inhibition gene dicB